MRLKKLIAASLGALMLVSATGCADRSPDSLLIKGATEFAEGQTEENYALANSGELIERLMRDFSGSFEPPKNKTLDDDDLKKLVKETEPPSDTPTVPPDSDDDDRPAPTTPPAPKVSHVVKSRDDLKEIFFEAYQNTSEIISFTLDGYDLDLRNDYEHVYEELRRDYPVETDCISSWSTGCIGNDYTVVISYSMPIDEVKRIKRDIYGLVDEAVSHIDSNGKSDREVVSAVNEYLCDHVEYNHTQPYPPESHTAFAALSTGTCVCDGYSSAAKLMLNKLGIECQLVIGVCSDGGGHAWNIVNVSGEWKHLDVTWNDGSYDRNDYFLVSDDYMRVSRTWDTSMYPPAP